jgi:hypothetical protein
MRKFIKNNWLKTLAFLPLFGKVSAQNLTPRVFAIAPPRTVAPPLMAIVAPSVVTPTVTHTVYAIAPARTTTPLVYSIAPSQPSIIMSRVLPVLAIFVLIVTFIAGFIWYQKNKLTSNFWGFFASKTFFVTLLIAIAIAVAVFWWVSKIIY